MAMIRRRISIANANPSAVAVIGPRRTRTWCPPGKKNRLISSAEMAMGRERSSDVRTSCPRTRAAIAGATITTTTSTSGPQIPPSTTAATAVTVARVALVSGFSRWNALGCSGRRNAGAARGVGELGQPMTSTSFDPTSRSPCGKRALVRRAMALRIR